jgi:hypothetical protein
MFISWDIEILPWMIVDFKPANAPAITHLEATVASAFVIMQTWPTWQRLYRGEFLEVNLHIDLQPVFRGSRNVKNESFRNPRVVTLYRTKHERADTSLCYDKCQHTHTLIHTNMHRGCRSLLFKLSGSLAGPCTGVMMSFISHLWNIVWSILIG